MRRQNPPRGRHRLRSTLTAAVVVLACALGQLGGTARPALAGPPDSAVLDWNLHAIDALINSPTALTPGAGQTPPVSILHLAMVQGAVYDAVNMIDGGYEPYLTALQSASPMASKAAAVATAAHHVLVGVILVPPLSEGIIERLNTLYADSIAAATIQDGDRAVAAGIAAGAAAADAMLHARIDDGRYGTFSFTVGDSPGEWQPTSGVNDPFAWVARVEPFMLESTSQFRTNGPHALTSGAYAREYNEVKDFGGNGTTTPSLRTPEQTALALFYTVHPVELFNRTFRAISEDRGLTLVEQARLFAMLNLAGADGLINCWDDKAFWSFWRPVTAIHEGDNDGNRRTAGDTEWTSLGASPPYPDHPSGYNCVTGSYMYTAEAFFGHQRIDFSVVRVVAGVPDQIREYERFADVVEDTIDARIYLGIHFRAADVQGAGIGRDVASWLEQHFFEPVD